MQHLEITRDIANRFNGVYGDVFTVPEGYVGKQGARIMSLADPMKKMSKSDENQNASIYLLDDKDTIMRKFKKAVTDSDGFIAYSDEKPGIRNLIDIYCACTSKTVEEALADFNGMNYGQLKECVGEAVVNELAPLQARYDELAKNKDYIDRIMKENAQKASYYANKTLRKVKKKVGFTEMPR